jgi:hypothetical protein
MDETKAMNHGDTENTENTEKDKYQSWRNDDDLFERECLN